MQGECFITINSPSDNLDIKALLNDRYMPSVVEEIEITYEEVKEIKDRLDFLELINNECLTFDPEEEDLNE